jgi:hypothetical protein
VQKNPCLLLEEIEGNLLHGIKININAAGMANGIRNAKDGETNFGPDRRDIDNVK